LRPSDLGSLCLQCRGIELRQAVLIVTSSCCPFVSLSHRAALPRPTSCRCHC